MLNNREHIIQQTFLWARYNVLVAVSNINIYFLPMSDCCYMMGKITDMHSMLQEFQVIIKPL